jgi:Holliday junction resolvase RusA-like endonuclease
MTIPIEFTVLGNPSSVNSTSKKKNTWKRLVEDASRGALSSGYPGGLKYPDSVAVKVFYFPVNKQYIDVDNGLKHTIDGLAEHILENDRTVIRIITERFPLIPGANLVVPIGLGSYITGALLKAHTATPSSAGVTVQKKTHVTAVKVEAYFNNKGMFW